MKKSIGVTPIDSGVKRKIHLKPQTSYKHQLQNDKILYTSTCISIDVNLML